MVLPKLTGSRFGTPARYLAHISSSHPRTLLVLYLEEQHAQRIAVGLERAAALRRAGEQDVRPPPLATRVACAHAGGVVARIEANPARAQLERRLSIE